MTKKLYLPVFVLLALSMILSACAAPCRETEAPVVVTEAPVVVTEARWLKCPRRAGSLHRTHRRPARRQGLWLRQGAP